MSTYTATCYVCGRWKDEAATEAAAAKKFLTHYIREHQP